MFTATILSAPSPRPNAGVSTILKKKILLSGSVGFLTGPGNSAAAILYYADSHPTIVVPIGMLTVYHVCAYEPDEPGAATAAIHCTGLAERSVTFSGNCAGVGVGVG